MRNIFIAELITLVASNPKIIVLSGDLGFSVFEELIEKYPQQFINCGVAEQSMTGIAAGLASEGFQPIIYSIIPFVTMRNFEQIRNDICYQNLPVVIVGVGAGFMYGPYGHTHHALEDIGVLRTLPNLTILAPGDGHEVRELTKQAMALHKPVYLRLGRVEQAVVPQTQPVTIGKWSEITVGTKGTIFATSTMLSTAHAVAQELAKKGFSLGLVSCHTFPITDAEALRLLKKTSRVITIEEHFVSGGLGSLLAELLGKHRLNKPFRAFGVPHQFPEVHGLQPFMRTESGLNLEYVIREITKFFHE